jgi:hypothetical protein
MVVSKTAIHTRLYKSVGFKLTDSVWNEEWQARKDTLRATREEYMARTADK